MMLIYSLTGPHRQCKHEDVSFEYILYLAGFLKTWLNIFIMVTALRISIGGVPSWLVSSSSLDPELTAHGVGTGFHVNP